MTTCSDVLEFALKCADSLCIHKCRTDLISMQALAHSLDEHKRLVAAKQNQELLLANHFKSINLGETTGQTEIRLTALF